MRANCPFSVYGGNDMLEIGETAPDFTLDGSGGRRVTLSERPNEYTILVFYPKNNTPG